MRTNIEIDDELMAEALRVTGIKTKKQVVREALVLLVRQRRRTSIFDLVGQIELADGYDHKALRGAIDE